MFHCSMKMRNFFDAKGLVGFVPDPKLRANHQEKEEIVMSSMKVNMPVNTRQPDGTGVPLMPRIRWDESRDDDRLSIVQAHLEAQLGSKEKAASRLRAMSGREIIALADTLRKDQSKTGIIDLGGGRQCFTMPRIKW